MLMQIVKTKIIDYFPGEILICLILTWQEVEGDNTPGPGVRRKVAWLRPGLDWAVGQPTAQILRGSTFFSFWVIAQEFTTNS